MSDNLKKVEVFYEAFNQLDVEKMVFYYHPNIKFTDPAFGKLEGEHAKNMWRMLCANSNKETFNVIYSNIVERNGGIDANWEAKYVFSQTGRKVHNIIKAHFKFKDGLIIEHTDNFSLQKWAKQALGFKGALLGGTSFFKKKLNSQTRKLLNKFESSI